MNSKTSFNLLSLRTKLSMLSLKWSNVPHIYNFNQHLEKIEKINLDEIDYPDISECRVIGYVSPKHPKYNCSSTRYSIYIITDMYNYLYVSLGLSHPILWYSIRVFGNKIGDTIINEIHELIELYDSPDNPNLISYDSCDYVLLGNIKKIKKDVNDIELELLRSNMVEIFMWGSKHKKYPYDRQLVFSSSGKRKIEYVTNALQQKSRQYVINCRTALSKSHIKIIKYQNFINLHIKYIAVESNLSIIEEINQKYDKNYPDDLPLDVILVLLEYPYLNHRQVINEHDRLDDIVSFLRVMIPENNRPQFLENLEYYCQDKNKVNCIKEQLS